MDTLLGNRTLVSCGRPRMTALCIALAALGGYSPPARAVDGCLVLLCFAAPSWRSIPLCVPPIRQVLHDLARGRPFPACGMAGAGNSAQHTWAHAPGNCPPQYVRSFEGEGSPTYYCEYSGAVSVTIDGALFTRTWWSLSGDSVTEYTPEAKARFGTWDAQFDDDYATWLATQPSAPVESDYGY